MENESWVTSAEAAAALQVTVNHIGWLGERGLLAVEISGGHRRVARSSLDELLAERSRWITLTEAGELMGCSSKTAQRLARQGLIRQRETVGTRQPSVDRSSVEHYLAAGRPRPRQRQPLDAASGGTGRS
ncbi:MAG: hypothetical protein JWN84_3021 [Nocardioides sp.]|nr:hypothetical protein [Nocardioides sp.]